MENMSGVPALALHERAVEKDSWGFQIREKKSNMSINLQ